METIGPTTRPMMILLLLLWSWVLLLGPSVYGSPLEIQLLEMMLREAESYPSNGRDQRDISVLPAASIGCDDKDVSMMQAASIGCDESGSQEQFSHIFDEYDESEECLDFLPAYEPSFKKELPVEHPCFVRLLLLRTPLLKQDPCANFSLAAETKTTTKKPKRKCNPKNKKKERTELMPPQSHDNKSSGACSPVNSTTSSPICSTAASPINSTTSSPICATPETEPNSKIIKITKLVHKRKKLQPNSTTTTTTTSTTTSTTMEPTTLAETTTPEETTSTSTEETTTTTELETTTTESTTTTSTTTTTQRPLTENQLKRYKAAQRRRKERKGNRKGTPKVPDPPKIKIDGATQPSEVIQVIMTTEAAELRLQPEESTTTILPTTTTTETTSTSMPETTTEDSCENEVETTKLPEFPESEDAEGEASDRSDSKGVSSMEEPCEDTEEQDTNLCPQFMPAAHSNPQSRPPAPYRSRKPVKNYVEPILYEGNFAKPLHRTAPMGPPQRDYIVSNKQIVPRPRPKYRKRIPPSIYMNNIVRGLDCSDEVDHHHSRIPTQPQRYWDVRHVGPLQRSQGLRKPRPERNLRSFAPVPVRRLHSHPGNSEEAEERQYPRERHPEPHPPQLHYPEDEVLHEERPMPPHAMPTPSLDPCQVEHDHALYGERREHHGDYPQTPASSHFFT